MTSIISLGGWTVSVLRSICSRFTPRAGWCQRWGPQSGVGGPSPPQSSGRYGIWLACMALIGITVCGAGLLVWGMHDRTVANYQSDANVLGTVLAERTARYVQVVDQVLQELQLRVRLLDVRGPEDFQARLGTLETHKLLRDHMRNLPPADAFILIDAAGMIASSSRGADQKASMCPTPIICATSRPATILAFSSA
jgi:hypothetical protein